MRSLEPGIQLYILFHGKYNHLCLHVSDMSLIWLPTKWLWAKKTHHFLPAHHSWPSQRKPVYRTTSSPLNKYVYIYICMYIYIYYTYINTEFHQLQAKKTDHLQHSMFSCFWLMVFHETRICKWNPTAETARRVEHGDLCVSHIFIQRFHDLGTSKLPITWWKMMGNDKKSAKFDVEKIQKIGGGLYIHAIPKCVITMRQCVFLGGVDLTW